MIFIEAEAKLPSAFLLVIDMLKMKQKICGECGACVAVCQFEALELTAGELEISYQNCTLCGECVLVCPVSALEIKDEG